VGMIKRWISHDLQLDVSLGYHARGGYIVHVQSSVVFLLLFVDEVVVLMNLLNSRLTELSELITSMRIMSWMRKERRGIVTRPTRISTGMSICAAFTIMSTAQLTWVASLASLYRCKSFMCLETTFCGSWSYPRRCWRSLTSASSAATRASVD
jgi:hypothetical protein